MILYTVSSSIYRSEEEDEEDIHTEHSGSLSTLSIAFLHMAHVPKLLKHAVYRLKRRPTKILQRMRKSINDILYHRFAEAINIEIQAMSKKQRIIAILF